MTKVEVKPEGIVIVRGGKVLAVPLDDLPELILAATRALQQSPRRGIVR